MSWRPVAQYETKSRAAARLPATGTAATKRITSAKANPATPAIATSAGSRRSCAGGVANSLAMRAILRPPQLRQRGGRLALWVPADATGNATKGEDLRGGLYGKIRRRVMK